MKLEGVTIEEVEAFLDSLTVEREHLPADIDYTRRAVFLTGVKVDGRLVAIGGISPSKRHYPVALWFQYGIVKSEFQGRGLSDVMAESIQRFARESGRSFLLSTIAKRNTAAIAVGRRRGYTHFYGTGCRCYSLYPLNRRGKMLARLVRAGMACLLPILRGIEVVRG